MGAIDAEEHREHGGHELEFKSPMVARRGTSWRREAPASMADHNTCQGGDPELGGKARAHRGCREGGGVVGEGLWPENPSTATCGSGELSAKHASSSGSIRAPTFQIGVVDDGAHDG